MAVAMVVLGSLGTACSDVVVDSIVVERSRGEPQACPSMCLFFVNTIKPKFDRQVSWGTSGMLQHPAVVVITV